MATIPEIKQKARYLLWLDENKDTLEAKKIITEYSKRGYDDDYLQMGKWKDFS